MIMSGAAVSADLGSSSNYSGETQCLDLEVVQRQCRIKSLNLEGRSGEGFLVNGDQTRVSRS